MRRTKIIATLGPASRDAQVLRKMIIAGVDVVRLNFSHGTHEEKKQLVMTVRDAAKAEGKTVGILADLQGPKIRIAAFKNGKVMLQEGATFTLDAALAQDAGDEQVVGIDYKELPQDVTADDLLLLDDGRLELVVTKVSDTRIVCCVKVGGELSDHKGINRQGGGLSAGALTAKDHADIKTAVALGVNYIAVSFVRSASDIEEAKDLIAQENGKAGVIAKIERKEAIVAETLQTIIKVANGIMVARGDLALEIGDAEVPAAQKLMIKCARILNKPVITATQMMETMVNNVTPTRAEVSDVANAVLDGTDAVMLSEETAIGKHPVLVVETMARVCMAAEKQACSLLRTKHYEEVCCARPDEVISLAAMYIANHLQIRAIVSLTETGMTPLWISRTRSGIPIYGLSRNNMALGKMSLYSDVYPVEFDVTCFANNIELKQAMLEQLLQHKLVENNDLVVFTSGDHIGVAGRTNTLTILQVT